MATFLKMYRTHFGDAAMKFSIHGLSHILDDLEHNGCRMDDNSAYKFENFHKIYNDIIKAGNLPLEQIRYERITIIWVLVAVR